MDSAAISHGGPCQKKKKKALRFCAVRLSFYKTDAKFLAGCFRIQQKHSIPKLDISTASNL